MRKTTITVLLILTILLLWILIRNNEQTTPEDTAEEQISNNELDSNNLQSDTTASASNSEVVEAPSNEEAQERFQKAFDLPIEFYGLVIDENKQPIQSASIEFIVTDRPYQDGSKSNSNSDKNGLFSLKSNGAAISVKVSKNGYYTTEQSKGVFRYATASNTPIPTKAKPAIFVLRKKGEQQSLEKNDVRLKVPRNGNPKYIDLVTGNSGAKNDSSLKIEAWVDDSQKDERGRYDWSVRLSIEGGGMIEREGRYTFVAPETGYSKSIEIVMPSDGENWSPQESKDYFVKLINGNYARLSFRMIAGGDNFVILKSWYNPSGSRNLE